MTADQFAKRKSKRFSMIKLVVFDMAGTTVGEDIVVYKTVRKAINSSGYSFTQDEVQAVGQAGRSRKQSVTFSH